MLNSIARLRQWLIWTLSVLGASMMTLLVMCVSWQVLSRYVLLRPSTLTDELARFLLIWLVLLGAAICTSAQRHLAIDLLQNALKPKARRILDVYAQAMVGAFAVGVMVVGGLRMVATSSNMGEISPALQMPMSYVYVALPFSGTLIFIFCLLNIIEKFTGISPISESVAEQEDLT